MDLKTTVIIWLFKHPLWILLSIWGYEALFMVFNTWSLKLFGKCRNGFQMLLCSPSLLPPLKAFVITFFVTSFKRLCYAQLALHYETFGMSWNFGTSCCVSTFQVNTKRARTLFKTVNILKDSRLSDKVRTCCNVFYIEIYCKFAPVGWSDWKAITRCIDPQRSLIIEDLSSEYRLWTGELSQK